MPDPERKDREASTSTKAIRAVTFSLGMAVAIVGGGGGLIYDTDQWSLVGSAVVAAQAAWLVDSLWRDVRYGDVAGRTGGAAVGVVVLNVLLCLLVYGLPAI